MFAVCRLPAPISHIHVFLLKSGKGMNTTDTQRKGDTCAHGRSHGVRKRENVHISAVAGDAAVVATSFSSLFSATFWVCGSLLALGLDAAELLLKREPVVTSRVE